ncbi:MAG: Ig-like domain-containing protein [Candidatus Symbiothrix sp.]|jgi:hypothetical protein|nr:Ig-like domain-containing protein [Candidatus Symbiothrix sp.]
MKKIVLFLVATLLVTGPNMFCPYTATAQVAIGGDGTVTPGALLDLSQATDAGGLLLPQIESADTATAVLKKPGMLVYNKTDGKIYAFNGSFWSAGDSGSGDIAIESILVTPGTTTLLLNGAPAQLNFITTYSSENWESSDETVATVSNAGVVTPVGSGTANITLSLGNVTSDPVAVTVVTCGSSITGASGNSYPTGGYPNATNGLQNLCWTLSNLKEAGQTYTNYTGKSEDRGYYYTYKTAANGDDICKRTLGSIWRLPTASDWNLLIQGYANFNENEKASWLSAPASMAGLYHRYGAVNGWEAWDTGGYWWCLGANEPARILHSTGTWQVNWVDEQYSDGPDDMSVRCVRDQNL